MKKTTTIQEKIAVRAYYAWQNGSTGGADADWIAAEQIERACAERRAAAARKAADARKARTSLPEIPAMVIATSPKRRPAIRFPTAH